MTSKNQASEQSSGVRQAGARLAYNARGYHARRSYRSWRCHDNVQLSLM